MPAITQSRFGRRTQQRRGTVLAEQIRDYIAARGLHAGDELPSESEFADRYGVSPRIVRDALRELAHQSVISTRQGKRAVVGDLRPTALLGYFRLALDSRTDAHEDIIELRVALEASAAGHAAIRGTDEELDSLLLVANDSEQFHTSLLHAAHNRFFTAVLESLTAAEKSRDDRSSDYLNCPEGQSGEDHRALAAALRRRDPAAAEELMRLHLQVATS